MAHSLFDNKSVQKTDNLVHAIAEDGSCMILCADTTDLVARAEWIHRPSATVTAALGRLLTAAGLMGALLKSDNDRLTLKMQGSGEIGGLLVGADAKGHVKGYPFNASADLPLNDKGKLDVGGVICGRDEKGELLPGGLLTVIRDNGETQPYVGQIPLVSGEVAEDITAYYATSEQIPTVCGLGVLVNPDLTPKAAGGFLLQVLPGGDDKTIEQLEKNVQAMPPVTVMLEQGLTPEEICIKALEGLSPQILSKQTVSYQCDCTRDRTDRGLLTLRKEGLRQLIEEDGKAELCCHFCEKKYRYNKKELEALLAQAEI